MTLLQDRRFTRKRRGFLDDLDFTFDEKSETVTKKTEELWPKTNEKPFTREETPLFDETRLEEKKSTNFDDSKTFSRQNDPVKHRYNSFDSDSRAESGDHAFCRSRSADEKPFCIDGSGKMLTCLNIKKCPTPSYLGFSPRSVDFLLNWFSKTLHLK